MLICSNVMTESGCGAGMPDGALHCGKCGNRLAYALRVADAGEQIGSYRIVELIGHGGFGAVYLADDLHSSAARRLALKQTFDAAGIRGFYDEFAVLRQLSHDHLPQYFDVFEADGQGYLAMEYVPGKSLDDIVNEQGGPLPEKVVLGYALQLCDVLSFLHERPQPILHRDIKPANIRLTPFGQIKLVDFGLLKQGAGMTRSSRRALTPTYAPLEQYGGAGGTDTRADQYSLAATLYHLLTGSAAPSAVDRLSADELRAPHLVQAGVSRQVSDALMRGLALRREERWPSVAELRVALLNERQLAAPNPLPVGQHRRPSSDRQPAAEQDPHADRPGNARYPADWRAVQQPHNPQPTPHRTDSAPVRLEQYQLGNGQYTSLEFNRDGGLLATASSDGTVRAWQTADGELAAELNLQSGEVRYVAFSPDSSALITCTANGLISRHDPPYFRYSMRTMAFPTTMLERVTGIAFQPGGGALAASYDRGIHSLFTIKNHKSTTKNIVALYRFEHDGYIQQLENEHVRVTTMSFSHDGTLLAVCGKSTNPRFPSGAAVLLRVSDGQELIRIYAHHAISRIAVCRDNDTVVTGTNDGNISFWRTRDTSFLQWLKRALDGGHIRTIAAHKGAVTGLSVNREGSLIASSGEDGAVGLWRISDGQLVASKVFDGRRVTCIAYHPDGTLLACGLSDGTIELWNPATT